MVSENAARNANMALVSDALPGPQPVPSTAGVAEGTRTREGGVCGPAAMRRGSRHSQSSTSRRCPASPHPLTAPTWCSCLLSTGRAPTTSETRGSQAQHGLPVLTHPYSQDGSVWRDPETGQRSSRGLNREQGWYTGSAVTSAQHRYWPRRPPRYASGNVSQQC